jgi:hypothetical protein
MPEIQSETPASTLLQDIDGTESANSFFKTHESVLLAVFHPIAPHWVRFAPVYEKVGSLFKSMCSNHINTHQNCVLVSRGTF